MRQRTLKPGFFKNEDLCAMPLLERLLFAGLLLVADRAGRFEDRPARIRAEVFPYEPAVDMESALAALESHGFIRRYTVSNVRYGLIPKFVEHQHPHPKEPASVIPPPGKSNGEDVKGNGEVLSRRAFPSVPSVPSDIPPASYAGGREADALNAEHIAAVEAVMAAIKYATEATGYDGSVLLSLPQIRPPKGAPIMNPASIPPTEQGIKLLQVTADRLRGFVAACQGDRIADSRGKRRKAPPPHDRGADHEITPADLEWDSRLGPKPAPAVKAPKSPEPEPPKPSLTLTVAPGSCPICGSALRHSTEGGDEVLRCSQESGTCDWAAVWRECRISA